MRTVLVISAVAVGLVSGCQGGAAESATRSASSTRSAAAKTTSGVNDSGLNDSGLPGCALDSLPAEVSQTVDDIHSGGPFVARKDGSTFRNRERVLPLKPTGFYREYTVDTPESSDRGARRIVTGGNPKKHPAWYFTPTTTTTRSARCQELTRVWS